MNIDLRGLEEGSNTLLYEEAPDELHIDDPDLDLPVGESLLVEWGFAPANSPGQIGDGFATELDAVVPKDPDGPATRIRAAEVVRGADHDDIVGICLHGSPRPPVLMGTRIPRSAT